MTRALEAGADAALQAEHVSQVVFVEFDFLSGVSRVCSREHSVSWNGFTWLGAGRVGSIEPVGEGGELEARGVAMTLSGLTPGLLATALTPAEYKGREVRIWFGQIEPEIIDFDFTQGTLTAAVGAALAEITFTRAGATATRVNELGLIEVVAADTARFDYDPVTLECKGLLNEESRTNRLLWATDVSNAAHGATWAKSGSLTETTVTGGLVVGAAAYKYMNTGGSGSAPVSQQISTFGGSLESAYVIVENVDADTTDLLMFSTSGSVSHCRVRLTWATESAAITVGSGTAHLEKISDSGPNGGKVFKLGLTSDTAAVSGLPRGLYLYPNGGVANTKGCIVHAEQYEVGAFITSLIPTTTATVTRSADFPKLPAGSWVNESEFTIFYEFLKASLPHSGGATAMVVVRTNNARAGYIVSGSSVLNAFDGTNSLGASGNVLPNVVARAAYTLDAAGQALSRDGGSVATGAFDGTFDSGADFGLGCNNTGTGSLNGHLRRFTYVPKRRGDAALVAVSGGADPRSLAVGTRIVASPAGPFIFKMDQLTYQLGSTATLRLTAESRLVDWNRPRVLRYNAADHQARHPGDKFFDYTERQVEAVHRW